MFRAHANSNGAFHWFVNDSWMVDYSLYGTGERAYKGLFSGRVWDTKAWDREREKACLQLEALERPIQKVERGEYRTYLSPGAVSDFSYFLGSIFGESGRRRGVSPLCLFKDQKKVFSPHFNFSENFRLVETPAFTSEGERVPEHRELVSQGEVVGSLIGSRSAKEYNLKSNGASSSEAVRAPSIGVSEQSGGSFSEEEALQRLETGLYISNVHYLNWSDRPKGRITGMTRYACFWVEGGEMVAPIENLRWDDSIFRLFGNQMEATTDQPCLFPSTHSYGHRGVGGVSSPGLLVQSMRFTL